MARRTRRYRLQRRAQAVDDTRRRITEAAVALHGTVGPARTTISAVADRAGVQRLTVYRHFPDETTLFEACSSHWIAENPPPDPGAWTAIADPRARLERALRDLSGYYARTAPMWERVYRDAPLVPALARPFSAWRSYLEGAGRALAVGWGVRGLRRRRLDAATGHAVDFPTWASLTRRGLHEDDLVALLTAMVRGALAGRRRAPRRPDSPPSRTDPVGTPLQSDG